MVAALCGALVGAGLWFACAPPAPRGRARRRAGLSQVMNGMDRPRLARTAGVALAVLVVTRWPVAAAGAGAAAWFWDRGARAARLRTVERTEALALWAELLRDGIGSAKGIEGVLGSTASAAPVAIRPEVQALRDRLAPARSSANGRPVRPVALTEALDELARDLDHPIGDLIVTALRLAATTGGGRTREVLSDVAAAAYAEADAHRRVEVARERPRAALRYTGYVVGVTIAALVLFSGSFLDAYDSPLGQVVQVLVGAYWAVAFWWMHRMARTRPAERFFAPGPGRASTGARA